MNTIVTKGAVFIRTNMTKRLAQLNHSITSIDNNYKSNCQKGFTYVEADIDKIESLNNYKPDLVYHLAAIARIKPTFDFSKDYFKVNTTLNLVH